MDNIEHMTLIVLELSESYVHYKTSRRHHREKMLANPATEMPITSGLVGISQAPLLSFCLSVSVTGKIIFACVFLPVEITHMWSHRSDPGCTWLVHMSHVKGPLKSLSIST